MPKEKDVEELNEALIRLLNENAAWRKKFEMTSAILSRRAPNAAGLSIEASVKTIIDERDASADRVQFFREELRNILQYLISSEDEDSKKANELRKRINLFLFNNPR